MEIKSILEYELVIKRILKDQGLRKEEVARVSAAYLRIFKDGMDFARGCLKVDAIK